MRPIRKGAEPQQLTEYRLRGGGTYGDFPDKQRLRAVLVAEQRGLCCYCLGRITREPGKMKIEHWKSQEECERSGDAADALCYWNLLGACKGGEGQREDAQHCDTRKGSLPLSRNPAEPRDWPVIAGLRYMATGVVCSDDPQFEEDINRVLNLNAARLKANRRCLLTGFLEAMGRRAVRQPQVAQWLREWSGEDTAGELPEYCEVVAYWLRKRLRRAA